MNPTIIAIEYFLPNIEIDNQQLEKEFPDWDSKKIEDKVGIKTRHVVQADETALDIALKAADKILKYYNKELIDFLLFCTESPDYFLPPNACLLQDRLKLPTSIGALDYNLGCSGYIYGLAIAKGLIRAGIAKSILLIMAETYTKYIHKRDKSNRTIFGDGAAATIIESFEQSHIGEFVFGTDGSGYENLIVPCGGHRERKAHYHQEIEDPPGSFRTRQNLYMNGQEIFNFTINNVPRLVEQVLLKNNITIDQIDCVVFHQANKYILNYLRKKMGIPQEKFYINMEQTGNTVSATIPIALKDCLTNNIIKKGDKVLLVGFGVGYSWGGTVISI